MKKNQNIARKKQKDTVKTRKIPEKYVQLPLVPAWLLIPLWLISLALPNLIYSGVKFADTLHIIKWTVTGVPIAIAVFIAGLRLIIYGKDKINIKLDLFAVIWAFILAYCSLQPLWVDVFSPTALVLEMVCFVTVWAFYIISVASFPDYALRPILLLGSLNGAINVLFAELQIRNMNNLNFLKGTIFDGLQNISDIILPTPGNYIGNTAQQNMFGLWTAIAVLGSVYLFVYDAWKNDNKEHGKKIWFPALSIAASVLCLNFAVLNNSILLYVLTGIFIIGAFVIAFVLGNDKRVYYSVVTLILTAVNLWGILNSTSRSGNLSLIMGLLVLLIVAAWRFNRNYVIRFLAVLLVMSVVAYVSVNSSRASGLVSKTIEAATNTENFGNREYIWRTSYAMFKEHPQGVGIGQYKWHYMEAQRELYKTSFGLKVPWQYTHWAHNEFLQFFCEGGIIGGFMFLFMFASWFFPALWGLKKRERMKVNINAVWGLGLTTLILSCAFFTRPFHRIENIVWITLAIAVSNREFFTDKLKFDIIRTKTFQRLIGFVCIVSSIAGCVYISGGIYGNWLLRQALSTQNPQLQIYLLEEANKHPIVREETQRNIAYHYIQLGEQTDDKDALAKGFNILWDQFNREPHSEDINRILNMAQKYQLEGVLREIKSYFKPGTYHLIRSPQQDANGNVINALLLVNGPGSDDL